MFSGKNINIREVEIRFRFKIASIYTGQILLAVILMLLLPSAMFAQLSQGGSPLKSNFPAIETEWINLEEVRVDDLLLEDKWTALTGRKNSRIAKEIQVSIQPEQSGTWDELPDGTLVWRLGIRGRGAKALGLVFDRYLLNPGTRIYVFDPLRENLLGAYTSQNNKASGNLPLSYLPGDELIIQMEIDPGRNNYGQLQIGSVRWAYLPVFDVKSAQDQYFGKSGACNVDINCSLGNEWQLVKNSVVRLINIEKCTGVLINNTLEDGKAYIYTAAHCVFQNNKYQPTVFYFNYESPTCDGPDGSVANSIAGATLISTGDTLENDRDGDSLDFALLELSVNPPDSFQPYFSGWNRSATPAQHSTAIHHPSGDVKKIAVDLDPPQLSYHTTNYFPDLIPGSHWRILEWDTATTEPGSSGCPLFDQNQLLIGTLTGGEATCNYQKDDYFTRFDYAWDYYSEPSKQLKYWLDPDNSGVETLQGMNGNPQAISRTIMRENLSLYPNPAQDLLTAKADLQRGKETEISIFHVTGKLYMHKTLQWEGEKGFDVSGLPPGVYIFRLRQDNRMATRQFIISR